MANRTLSLRRPTWLVAVASALAVLLVSSRTALADIINFHQFVAGSDISTATGGQQSTIGFTYAGDKFVGSVYFGDSQLYQTNLNGTGVTAFGAPVPGGFLGEIVVGAALGN